MRGSQQKTGRRGQGHGQARDWFSRGRDAFILNVFAGLVVLAITAAVGLVLGAGPQIAVVVVVALVAFIAGGLMTRRLQRTPEEVDEPAVGEPSSGVLVVSGARDVAKLTSYLGFFAPALSRLQVGELDNVEAELLIRPARLFEQFNRGSVQLAVLEPIDGKGGEASWHLPYVAGISRSECREFEVPIKVSYLAQRQVRWEPRDGVFVASDLQEERWFKAGADFEAFAEAGFRMLRCLPFGAPSAEGKRACLVLLSKENKESGTFSGADDFLLRILGALLSIQAVLAGRAPSVAEEGEASD
ncbi:MAG TPA: hypothetical protein VLC07_02200 [Solirubrobacterales bacterium]|nr:hypothetical protein [Solirubrobacterales bacterium]